jgi:hypothetical protein
VSLEAVDLEQKYQRRRRANRCRVLRFRAWRDVLRLARRLGIEVRVEALTSDELVGRSRLSAREKPDEGSDAPMWDGWVVEGKEVVCNPLSDDAFIRPTQAAAQLLHELAHAVCGMDEGDVMEWEVYTAICLWGPNAVTTRRVVRYQKESCDEMEFSPESWANVLARNEQKDYDPSDEPGFGRHARAITRARLRQGLPPSKGPDPRPPRPLQRRARPLTPTLTPTVMAAERP